MSNIKTNIVVSLQIEGFHCWPQAFPAVDYLRDRHRHIFHITCKKNVDGIIDREIEIIEFKRKIQRFLLHNFGNKNLTNSTESSYCEFGSLSCESIAQFLLKSFDLEYCLVLEDAENGSEVLKNHSLVHKLSELKVNHKKVTFVVGELCSGKSTVARNIPSEYGTSQLIELGDIVRHIVKREQRVHTNAIDTEIIKMVIDVSRSSQIIIVGPRTMTVMISLREYFKSIDYEIEYVLIHSPDHEILEKRYLERGAKKDQDLSFRDAWSNDMKLGLGAIIEYLMKKKSGVKISVNQ